MEAHHQFLSPEPAPGVVSTQLVPGSSLRRQIVVGACVLAAVFALVVAPRENFRRAYKYWRHTGTLEGRLRPVDGPIGYRSQAATVALGDGRVLIWGGRDVSGDSGSIYDPASDTWARLPPAPVGGRSSAATAWTGQEALIWGGSTGSTTPSGSSGPQPRVEAGGIAFNPSTGTWRELPAAPVGLDAPRAVALDGGVLFAGGRGGEAVSLWLDLDDNTWTLVPAPVAAVNVVRDGDRVLATGPARPTGGFQSRSAWSVAAFDPTRMTWSQVASPIETEWMALAVAGDGALSAVTRDGLNAPLRAYQWTGGAWNQVAETSGGAGCVQTIEIVHYPPMALWTGQQLLVGPEGGLTSWEPSTRRFATQGAAISAFGGKPVWTGSSVVALSSQNSEGWVWTPAPR